MPPPVPSCCPLCSHPTEVTEVSCESCGVQIRGKFTPGRFDRLDVEQVRLLETFLRCRGVIRDMEVALGVSYPTVRGRLDALLSVLDLADGPKTPAPLPPAADKTEDKAAARRDILAAIDAGKMSADAGLKALQDLS
jgi:hypothetical protein